MPLNKQLLKEMSSKHLKNAKKKDEATAMGMVDAASTELRDYYFNEGIYRSERESRKVVDDIFQSRTFLKLLKKVIKKDTKELIESRNGISFILFLQVQGMANAYRDIIGKIKSSNIDEAQKSSQIAEVNEKYNATLELIKDIQEKLNKKNIKKLMKMGVSIQFAPQMASLLLPSEYVTEQNVGFFSKSMFKGLMELTEASCAYYKDEKNNNTDSYVSKLGISLESPSTIGEIMDKFVFKDADTSTIKSFIISSALHNKEAVMKVVSPAQKACYNAITEYILSLMNSDVLTKQDRVKIINEVGKRAAKYKSAGKVYGRRIVFGDVVNITDMDGSIKYPKIVKAWKEYKEDSED